MRAARLMAPRWHAGHMDAGGRREARGRDWRRANEARDTHAARRGLAWLAPRLFTRRLVACRRCNRILERVERPCAIVCDLASQGAGSARLFSRVPPRANSAGVSVASRERGPAMVCERSTQSREDAWARVSRLCDVCRELSQTLAQGLTVMESKHVWGSLAAPCDLCDRCHRFVSSSSAQGCMPWPNLERRLLPYEGPGRPDDETPSSFVGVRGRGVDVESGPASAESVLTSSCSFPVPQTRFEQLLPPVSQAMS